MPFYRTPFGMVHVKLSGNAKRHAPRHCVAPIDVEGKPAKCCAMATILCDWKLSDGGTCDAPLCLDHAVAIGPDKHLCPRHAAERAVQQPELF